MRTSKVMSASEGRTPWGAVEGSKPIDVDTGGVQQSAIPHILREGGETNALP